MGVGDTSWLIRVVVPRGSQDEGLKGGTLPWGHQTPLLTQYSSAAGRGHKDFPTQVVGPSPALMLTQRRWLSQGPDPALVTGRQC